ncbi:serine/threonine protein kinase [Sulfurifustis variabilis]|uniref:non-specific serine/threonine protein kinase n=1 Tax=Sulfurifustis variabilis TaxID=1675686 RepID=A0A1B4V0S5_9GAMM|nr:bifunctional serine/threonine-protein kinase/universal stress protein [Sulfurifustis variabilis]BAU47060.1 serine/threonine protein kinase [Sulfurifustis variabilis]
MSATRPETTARRPQPSASLCLVSGELQPNSVVDGMTVERKIGEGAMASLYLVRSDAGEPLVIKVPCHSLQADPVSLVAFENELRLAPYLQEFPYAYMPRIRREGSGDYLVMDYIQGVDLWSYLKEHGCLAELEAIALAKKIVRATAELHKRRIVHLDLKLSNVMITPAREVRLIDFGLANHLDLPDLIHESFREPKGTPAYIAPEQFIGIRDEPRSDIFSVGTMLFEMTTGKLPFPDAQTPLDVIRRIKRAPCSPCRLNPALSSRFEALVLRCLAANPEDRFATMDALYRELDNWAPPETPTSRGVERESWMRRLTRLPSRWTEGLLSRTDHFTPLRRWAENRCASAARPFRMMAALALRGDRHQEAVNVEILRQAFQMARLRPSFVSVMTVVQVDVGMASGEKADEILNEHLIKARRALALLVGKVEKHGTPFGINVVTGNVVDAVREFANDYRIDLVVIGCRPRRSFPGFGQGRTGQKILASVKRSVLAVQTRDATVAS